MTMPMSDSLLQENETLRREVDELRQRLDEAEQTLQAIRAGEVDAVLVEGEREAVFTLEQADRPYRLLVEQMTEGAATLTLDGTILYCNHRFADLLKQPTRTLVGRRLHELAAPASRAALEALLQNAKRGSTQAEIELQRSDNRAVPVYLDVSAVREGPIGLCLLVTDLSLQRHYRELAAEIAERKRVEQALRQSEARWRTLTEALPNLVWTDLPDGQCDWLSSQWGKYTGIPEQELLGVRWLERVIHPDDRARTLALWQAACADQAEYDLEYRIRRHDGEYHWFKTRGVPVRDEGGKIIHWFGTCTDVEEFKRMEAALREADRRKDQFVATLAHELRNPLAPIRNSLNILHMAGCDSASAQRVLEMMDRQVNHMVRLVDDLMEVSRITRDKIELRKEQIELSSIVRSAVETSKPLIDAARHQLAISLPAEPLILDADPVRLAQVLSNLLNNAAKFTEAGGQLALSARRDGAHVVIAVRDNGMGIPADMLPNVFDLFMQGDRSYSRAQGGLGIGLTLVRSLVDLHGGSIEAKSDGPGRGSEFIVRLPLSGRSLSARAWVERADRLPTIAPRRILVVDDNRDAADSLAILLRSLGADVRTANDGPTALETLRTYRPSVVLLDIGMPGMDGYEVARRARLHPAGQSATLIMLTGWGQEEERRRSQELGIEHHLIKPVDLGVLQALLASLPLPSESDAQRA